MKRLLFFLLFLSTILLNISAEGLPVGNPEDGNTIVSTSQKKLNIRKGAGTNYGVAAQLLPGEYAWVTDTESVSSGWVKINTGKKEGYVKTDFIRSANGNDYIEWSNNFSEQKDKKTNIFGTWLASLKDSMSISSNLFLDLHNLKWWKVLCGFLVMIALQVCIILFLKSYYRDFKSPALLYVIIGITFLINLIILSMYPASDHRGRYSSILWLMLFFSVFPLYVHSCWRLEQNGKVRNIYYRKDTKCGYWGKYLGILGWILMILPIFYSTINITNNALRGLIPIPDQFLWLLLTLVIIVAINAALIFYWMEILKLFFATVSNIIVYIITTLFFFTLCMAEFDVISTFNGLNYVVAFICMLIIMAGSFAPLGIIREDRCSNCHGHSAYTTHTTDEGGSTSKHDRWVGIDNSSIESNKRVTDAEELQRTIYTYEHYTKHRCCEYCGKTWKVSFSKTVNIEKQSLKRKWTEHG